MTAFEIAAAILFWLCLAAMAHTYIFYPFTLRLFRKRYGDPPQVSDGDLPIVAVLVPAYNEKRVIEAKVRNALALEYPADKLTVLVGSDGSTDRTNEIVRSIQDPRLRLIELPGRSGKSGVLNRLVAETAAEIVVFTDANVAIESGALRRLARHFADPKVGVAGGGKYITIPAGSEAVRGEALYGRYENRLRTAESRIGGMSGVLGSFMAMRRSLFRPFARGDINDDTTPSIWAVLEGFRNVYDPEARAFEESGHSVRQEFRRRIRIGAGNFQTLFRYWGVMSPRHGVAAYTYFSHKALRWSFPFFMLGALIANLFLLKCLLYQIALAGQLFGYGIVLIGFLLDHAGRRLRVVTSLYHFVALNVGLLLGFFVYLRGISSSAWQPTEREAGA